jgi:hypothetical protein
MKKISDLEPDFEIASGTILRWYGVKRRNKKKKDNYYDVLLFDANILKRNTWALINCTSNSSHKGFIYWQFNCKNRFIILASVLHNYFGDEDVYVLDKGEI